MKKSILICIGFAVTISVSMGTVYFNDGQYHCINYEIADVINIDYGLPTVATQVELVNGGSVEGVGACGDSSFTMSGGQVGWSITSAENSHVTVEGGYIVADLNVHSPYTFIKGGSFRSGVAMNGCLYISGGLFRDHVEAYNTGRIIMTGGTITKILWVENNTYARVAGGTIQGDLWAGHWFTNYGGFMQLEGHNFVVNGQPIAYGESVKKYADTVIYYNDTCLSGRVTGTLSNGDLLDNVFYIWGPGDIQVIEEPAPVAVTGGDQKVFAWIDGLTVVTLDGTRSYDSDNDTLEYFWFEGSTLIATGPEPNVVLAVGVHVIDLVVNDGMKDSESASCVVTVLPAIQMQTQPGTVAKSKLPLDILVKMVLPEGSEPFDLTVPMTLGPWGIEAYDQFLVARGTKSTVYARFRLDRSLEFPTTLMTITATGQLQSGTPVFGYSAIRIR